MSEVKSCVMCNDSAKKTYRDGMCHPCYRALARWLAEGKKNLTTSKKALRVVKKSL